MSNKVKSVLSFLIHLISIAIQNSNLIIITAGEDLLAGGAQHKGVFVLRSVGARHVHQRRISIHQASVDQLLH